MRADADAAELMAAFVAKGILFWPEGDRLRFRSPRGVMTAGERALLSDRRAELLAHLRNDGRADVHPLSFGQQSLWFLYQQAKDSTAYNIGFSVRIKSEVCVEALRHAVQALVDRHPVLRTEYGEHDSFPVQRVYANRLVDLTQYAVTQTEEAQLRSLVEADLHRPFNLESGPVLRASLYSVGNEDHVFLLAVHHIAADGWSLSLLFAELLKLYAEATGGPASALPRPSLTYVDYVKRQLEMLDGEEGERLWSYWSRVLAPPRAMLDLPTDYPRPTVPSYRGASATIEISQELVNDVKQFALNEKATLFPVLLAGFQVLLFRLSNSADLVVGTPTFGRRSEEMRQIVGHFVNVVPIRTRLDAGMTFRELVARVRQSVMEAVDAQEYPLPLMVRRLRPDRDTSRNPLFDTFFQLQRSAPLLGFEEATASADAGSAGREKVRSLVLSDYPLRQVEGQFDLALQMSEEETGLRGVLKYNIDLFQQATVERMINDFQSLLDRLVRDPDATVGAAAPSRDEHAAADALLRRLRALDVRVFLERGTLRMNAPRGSLNAELKSSIAANKQAIIAALTEAGPDGVTVVRSDPDFLSPSAGPRELSFAQRRLWFLDRTSPGSASYNVSLVLHLQGPAELIPMQRALEEIVRRHEVLRLAIPDVEGVPSPVVLDAIDSVVEVFDLANSDESAREVEGLRLATHGTQRSFDVARGPLAAFRIVRLDPCEHLLTICMHHIAADGWSLSLAVAEFGSLYAAFAKGEPSPLPKLSLQYSDYAAWQLRRTSSSRLQRQVSYWREALASVPATIGLPTDRRRPAVQTFRGSAVRFRLDARLLEGLRHLSRQHKCTLYMTLLAAWQILLHRYSGQSDLVVGSPIANRERPELEKLIGCFVNNVVLRSRVEGTPSFAEFLAQTTKVCLDAFENSDVPFEALVQALRLDRSTDHAPVFQVLMALHSYPITGLEIEGLKLRPVEPEAVASRFDLTLDLVEFESELRASYEYASDLFDESTIVRMHESFVLLLQAIVADPAQRLMDLPILTAADQTRLLGQWNDTRIEHDPRRCLHHLLEVSARRQPAAPAVTFGSTCLSYRDLDEQANRLAHLLVTRAVARGDLVAICLDRTTDMAVAMAAVLKAGAAYVPLDPTHPADRLRYTLEDAGVRCVITLSQFAPLLDTGTVSPMSLDTLATELSTMPSYRVDVRVEPQDLAYVIYTSGSTGRPKGVEVEHRNVVSFLEAMRRMPGFSDADTMLAVTTLSFDIAGLEFWLPLSVGGQVVVASRTDVLDGARLSQLLQEHRVTVMQATPATWRLMLEAGWAGKDDLRILCGGEALPRDLAATLVQRAAEVWNMYGPTETTIWSTVARIEGSDGSIPIGEPIANTRVYVLEPGGALAPVGVHGELCIAGEGVARGYRNRPELTVEKFVTLQLPGGRAERAYRTGDVVRFRSDGKLEYVGRRDQQVKLRGYRIELEEIEAVLSSAPGVTECAVAVREDTPAEPRLVGYVVANAATPFEAEEARAALRAKLPEYMVPSLFVTLDALPLTLNGKVDRKSLPAPTISAPKAVSGQEHLMNPVQKRVAEIWREVLKVDRVGLHDNFFDVGGHSLLLVRLQSALRSAFAVDFALVELFQRTTVASQAERFAASAQEEVGNVLKRAQARAGRRING